jgi:N-ethylmaleimide reductase
MSFQEVIKIGSLRLRNRIVMAAMTRQRAGPTGVPNELMVEYYKQRAGAGLIITEGTQISESSGGDPGAARLYNQQQADGWKRVIHAVKKQDGNIFLQLYHVGRRASQTTTGGFPTIGPSPIAPRGKVRSTE